METTQSFKNINNAIESKRRINFLLLGHVILWIAFLIVIMIIGDNQLTLLINPKFTITDNHWSYHIIKLYSDTFYVVQLGTLVLTIIFLSVPKLRNYRRPMLEAFFSILIAGLFIESLKDIVARPRPFQEGSEIRDQVNIFGESTDSGSMPSGHVGYTGAAVLPHAFWIKKIGISIFIAIYGAVMMVTRIFLGVHYPTDVLVGNIIGFGAAVLSFLLFQIIYKNRTIQTKHEWMLFGIGMIIFAIQLVLRL